MKYEIEKGIPIPERIKHGSKYPVARLKIGESFFEPDILKENSIRTVIAIYKKRNQNGVNFTVARENTGLRIWRTK